MSQENIFIYTEKLLSEEKTFCSSDGKLLRSAVLEAAEKMNPVLLEVLIKNEKTKAAFFADVNGTLVFDKVKFCRILQNKSFLPDSYTMFKNKIGLTDSNGNFISSKNDVELVFPHKDCILEGGQTKEEKGRKEIFYNETLAPEQVTNLLAPKAFCNAKRYEKDDSGTVAERVETKISNTDNLIIKGNNLLALSSLLECYAGKVKCIYIDPPYNTGNDEFNYNDNFNHSSWLVFMKNRLELARKLLKDDGCIFISIDTSRQNSNGVEGTSEFPYLNVLCDEIFGRKNFIANLHWKKKKQPSFLSRVAGVMETIIVYAKDERTVGKLQLGETSDSTKRIDNASNKITTMKIEAGIKYMGDANFVIKKGVYQNKTMTTEFLDDVEIKNGRTVNSFRANAKYRNSQSEITKFCKQDLIYITANNSFRRFKTENEENSAKTITDLLLDWGQNQDATDELRKLFDIKDDSKIFDNPKPELLMHNIIECFTEENDLVLDFHLGSGTTAAVAHKMNRQYIGVEQMDYINTVTVERLKKVIAGEQGGISKAQNWQGGGSFVYCELAKQNQSFVEQIQECKTDREITELTNKILKSDFVSTKINPSAIDTTAKDYAELSFENKQKFAMEILDKNTLYINVADVDDESLPLTEPDRTFTKSFYGKAE